ncbi:hypothetical protein [Lacrimispora indolis]|uniref:hypothetical protein n=1 Tax=Lacrimispora indolis TaxID=69825 RepID=UPI0004629E38|nr:hypothetical protein [[Clostridium] methoxybenzovorans]
MDNIILYDSTSIEIEEESSEYSFSKYFKSIDEFYATLKLLTETNLSSYVIKNSSGLISATYTNKRCKSTSVTVTWNDDEEISGILVVFTLEDVDLVEKELKKLRASQKAQNSAIIELAALITELKGGTE